MRSPGVAAAAPGQRDGTASLQFTDNGNGLVAQECVREPDFSRGRNVEGAGFETLPGERRLHDTARKQRRGPPPQDPRLELSGILGS